MLAFYSPNPHDAENITEYDQTDLSNPEVVKNLFDYCQILEGYITKSGWEFLISRYGYEALYEINKKSGWLDAGSLEEYIKALDYEIELGSKLE